MRVYLLGSSYTGCNYLRIRLPAWTNGFLTDTPTLSGKRDDTKKITEEMMSSDVVVLHRPETPEYHKLAILAKQNGAKLVMDNDDTFLIDDNHPLANITPEAQTLMLKERQESIETFLEHCDLVTTTTETLAEEYRKINKNVVILPNCVNPDDWEEPVYNETNKVRIGMVNSAAFEYDFLHIRPLIKKLAKRNDVEFVLFGLGDARHRAENKNINKLFKAEYKFWDSVAKEHQPWVHIGDYMETLNNLRLDIMLIPRKDNYFNRCKSNVKFLESAMCGVPVIAQSFPDGPYEEITPDIGRLVKGDDWESTIEELINDKKLRRELGKNARDYVIKHYDISIHAHKWAEAYNKLFNQQI